MPLQRSFVPAAVAWMLAFAMPSAEAETFTVTTIDDAGIGSLRQAILDANATTGLHAIAFDIPGAGPHTIEPVTPLPTIERDSLVIDGYTQPGTSPNTSATGSNAVLRIELRTSSSEGLRLSGSEIVVRGLAVNGNASVLIVIPGINGQSNNVVEGCFIGTDVTGMIGLSSGSGVRISGGTGHRIGGHALAARNLISGTSTGINILNEGNNDGLIVGNAIGVNALGQPVLGNFRGILVSNGARGWTIGDVEPSSWNRIAGNTLGLIVAEPGVQNVHTQARIGLNEFFDNDGMGIDLAFSNFGDGVTPNDVDDGDAGPNGVQNFPVLVGAERRDGRLRIAGSLDRPASIGVIAYWLAFFANSGCDSSGHGEGELPLGLRPFISVGPNAQTFTIELPDLAPVGGFVTATATRDNTGETSEFSACVEVTSGDLLFEDGFDGLP